MTENELIQSICFLAKDYREEDKENFIFDEEHILLWIKQFKLEDRYTILHEINYILQNNYISKTFAMELFEDFLSNPKVKLNLNSNFESVKFLEIQRKGSSQTELLGLVDEILVDNYGITVNESGGKASRFVYIDDCLFSGNTVYYDIKNWVEREDITNVELTFFFFGVYSKGERYLNDRLDKLLGNRNIKYSIWRIKTFKNLPDEKDQYQCCWPDEKINDNELQIYVNEIKEYSENYTWKPRLFYPGSDSFEETLFSSLENRVTVEDAFLEAGIEIRGFCKSPKRTMRPLGYDNLESLGFGAMFITYRNIANNCPLALWWGGPEENPPLNNWYPLFPRKVNEFSVNF